MARRKFEYLTLTERVSQRDMDRLGHNGWELVAHTALLAHDEVKQYYVFKRELLEEEENG